MAIASFCDPGRIIGQLLQQPVSIIKVDVLAWVLLAPDQRNSLEQVFVRFIERLYLEVDHEKV